MMITDVNEIIRRLESIARFAFVEQGRKSLRDILIVVIVVHLFIKFSKVVVVQKWLKTEKNNTIEPFISKNQWRLLILFIIFTLVYSIFCAANFFMLRYFLCFFPLAALVFMIFVDNLLFKNKFLILAFAIGITSTMFHYIEKNKKALWNDDASMNYSNMIQVHQEVVRFCETNNWYNRPIYAHFLMKYNLTIPLMGYLQSDRTFKTVHYDVPLAKEDEIVIISAIEYNEGVETQVKTDTGFVMVKRFEKDGAWSEIYVK
jgi:hypothetical protein